MNVTLRQLQYFRALAEHRNFGRAAEACHVSQPALSVQIREMESQLGAPLVERGARGVVLTRFGRQVLGQTERILSELQMLERLARHREGLGGQLSLGVIPTIAPYLLPGALAALRARDILLDVEVTEAKTDRLLDGLRDGTLDAALIALPAGQDWLEEAPLFEDRFVLAGSGPRIAALTGGGPGAEALRPTQLGQAPLMLLEDGHCLTEQALEVCGRDRGHARINTGASSLATLSRLVAAGFGLTLMPELALGTEAAAARGIALARFAPPEPARRIGLVRRAGAPEGPSDWFAALAALMREVGEDLVAEARRALPTETGAAPHVG